MIGLLAISLPLMSVLMVLLGHQLIGYGYSKVTIALVLGLTAGGLIAFILTIYNSCLCARIP